MRNKLEHFFSRFGGHTQTYLQGPAGSGKTYLTRAFVPLLSMRKEWSQIFALHVSFSHMSDTEKCNHSNRICPVEAFFASSGKSKGWQNCKDVVKALELPLNYSNEEAYDKTVDWEILHDFLKKRECKMVIIVDDYDVWRGQRERRDEEFRDLIQLQQEKVEFLLTSRERLVPIVVGSVALNEEKDFLGTFEEVRLGLLSDKEAIEIAHDYLGKLRKKITLNDDHYNEIIRIAGNHPGLIVCLLTVVVKTFNEEASVDESNVDINKIIQRANIKKEFEDYVVCLWNSLTESEKTALNLVINAENTGRQPEDVYAILRQRYPNKIPWQSEQNFKTILNKIKTERLLLSEKHDKEFVVPLAISSYISDASFGTALLSNLVEPPSDYVEDSNRFDLRKFFKKWILGASIYLLLLFIWPFMSPPLSQRIGFQLPNEILLIVWLPAFVYVLRYVIKKVIYQ